MNSPIPKPQKKKDSAEDTARAISKANLQVKVVGETLQIGKCNVCYY